MKINKRFQNYIDGKNRWFELVGGELITFPLSQYNVNKLVGSISNELSPENLCCDGEISPTQARARGKLLSNVLNDIEKYTIKYNLKFEYVEY